MDEKILERMLNNLIEEAGPIAIENMEKEASFDEIPDIEFSKKHEEKMKEIFELARKKELGNSKIESDLDNSEDGFEDKIIKTNFNNDTITEIKKSKRISKNKLAMVIAATMVVLGLTITSVSAWRESFSNYFLDKKEKYSDVKDFKQDNAMYIDNIYFGYIPNGFEYKETPGTKTMDVVSFVCNDEYFTLKKQDGWNSKINTESGDVIDLIINEKEMVYYEQNNIKYISWKEADIKYLLYSNCDKSTMEKIIENIKFH